MSRSHNLNQLRETLQSLENTEIPAKFLSDTKNAGSTAALHGADSSSENQQQQLVRRYKGARDEYLRRRIEQAVCAHVASFDGKHFPEVDDVPSDVDRLTLEQRQAQVKQQVLSAASQVQTNLVALKQKYANFVTQREELQGILQEMEASGRNDSTLEDQNENDDDAGEPVDEQFFAQQEERLVELQRRKVELQADLARVQQENTTMQKATKEGKEQVDRMQSETSDEKVELTAESGEKLQAKNDEMQQQVARMEEISVFYSSLSSVMEELGGIKVLSVDEAPAEADEDLILTVQVLQEHEIQVGLKQVDDKDNNNRRRNSNQDSLRLVRANFLTDTLVQAPPVQEHNDSIDNDEAAPLLEMKIPDMADLVRLAENLPAGEDLRFVLRETMARITVTKARVAELALLKTLALTKIGKSYHTGNSFGGEDQDVVCSLNDEQMTVVLRLTPDCPVSASSVYMEQLVGVGGWQEEKVQEIKERIDAQQFSSPVALLRAVKAEIARMAEGGMVLPRTPTMPLRRAA
jgi:hypothetical protein